MTKYSTMDWQHVTASIDEHMKKWVRAPEYHVQQLKAAWPQVDKESWMARIEFVRIDDEHRLHVSVPNASALRMELGYRGDRWKQLLETVRRVCNCEIADLVIGDAARRTSWRRSS